MKIQKNIFTFVLIWLLPQLLMIFYPGWGEALAGVSSFRDYCFMGNQYSKRPIGATWKATKSKGVFYLYQRFADGDRPIKRLSPYKFADRKSNKYHPEYIPPEPIPVKKIDYQEFWIDIEDYPYYQVSNYGDIRKWIRSKKQWKYLKQWVVKNGYKHISLVNNNAQTAFSVHRIIMLNFSNIDRDLAKIMIKRIIWVQTYTGAR